MKSKLFYYCLLEITTAKKIINRSGPESTEGLKIEMCLCLDLRLFTLKLFKTAKYL